jgi:hypothetical protein
MLKCEILELVQQWDTQYQLPLCPLVAVVDIFQILSQCLLLKDKIVKLTFNN